MGAGMRCTRCGSENPNGKKFCGDCGASLGNPCPNCHADNPVEKRFCGECGATLSSVAPITTPAKTESPAIRVTDSADAALDGERKTVTLLFADIKGSMDLMEDLDPEDARTVVDPTLNLMIEACRHYDGYVAQSTGDGIFALFGAPLAHEDHPQRALYAALRIQEEMRRYSARLRQDGRLPLEARVGVNTGEVVVRSIRTGDARTEYTPIGHSAGLAARMQALAPTGSIAATEAVRKLCEGYFIFESLGPTRVKGVSEPVNVYEVTGLGPLRTRLQRSAGRGLTKFVGRRREMDAMKHAAEQAKAGHGQIVAAIGEPGVGKSRLLFEFKAISQSGSMVLEAFSVSHGKASAFLPVIDLLWSYFEISSDDDERKRREKINGKIVTLDRSLEDALPYLHGLLGLSDENSEIAEVEAQTRKRRALDAIKRILLRESINQPLIVIFEDLHWIDSESQAFLNLLADSIGTARILLLINYRPEYRHEWGHKTYYTQLRLDPLGKESADEMLSALLDDGVELAPLKRLIVERTEGNPFFMEETVQVLFDDGALVRNGNVKLTKPLRELKIPPTVQDILAARIDRLVPDHKELLQTLAVIGTEFKLGLVRKVAAKPEPELGPMLSELQLGEFIYEQPAVGDTEYIFKHALTHDVAYHSVLIERRRVLHERIGAALESIYAESLDDHVGELAHHYARSSNPGKGVEYCLRAVQQCVRRGSFAEALTQFETGLAQLQRLPNDDRRAELELDLRNDVNLALVTIKGYGSPESEQFSRQTMLLCQRPGIDWEKSWLALAGIFPVLLTRPDLRGACEIGKELVARAEQHGSPERIAQACQLLGFASLEAGAFDFADQQFERGAALHDSMPKPKAGLSSERFLHQALIQILWAWNSWVAGYPERALERVSIATAVARAADSKVVWDSVHHFGCRVYQLRADVNSLREWAELTRQSTVKLGNPFRHAIANVYLGWADVEAGDLDDGIARMREGVDEIRNTGAEIGTGYFLALIATALSRMGKFDEGLRNVNEGLSVIERTGDRVYEVEVRRIRGELLLAQDSSNAAEAERIFRTAIDIAREQSAKSWELRATTSLARLLRDTNRRDEARAMVAEIYGWFTEGFDTADLKDAKALLQELNA